ncbi:uncharacterized protein LOC111204088 [Brassica napus]|uniref:uncharacterized protein LOC111204088 n=1 Tax=Brassica napus TaxID=3708 RepID=UPI000BBE61B2|nr:uncharacterized protein LOC111204088 [Brassica napus]
MEPQQDSSYRRRFRLRRVFYWITDGAAGRFIELQNIWGTSQTHPQMASRKPIVCGLSARGIMPPLQPEVTDEDVADNTPTEVEVVEISDEEEDNMVELSCEGYRRNMGYLIRVEESEGDTEPEFRRML